MPKLKNKKSKIKKYIPLIALISGFVIIPLFALSAIHGPNECCILDHGLADIDPLCTQGATIAATSCNPPPVLPNACLAGNDNCMTDGNGDGDWVDPEDYPCEECWCDADDDGQNNAMCAGGVTAVTKNWGTCCIVDTIYNVTDWVFYVFLIGIALVVIMAGYFFLTSGGDPNKLRSAQSLLLYAGVGLTLAVLSRIVPAIIKQIVS